VKKGIKLLFIAALYVLNCSVSLGEHLQSLKPATERTTGYIQAGVGASLMNTILSVNSDTATGIESDLKPGYALFGSVGLKHSNWRSDISFRYNKNSIKSFNNFSLGGHVYWLGYMLNGYYDIHLSKALQPFLGIGLGVVTNYFRLEPYDQETTRFSYQGIMGINYIFRPTLKFFIQLIRQEIYNDIWQASDGSYKTDQYANFIDMGIAYYFSS